MAYLLHLMNVHRSSKVLPKLHIVIQKSEQQIEAKNLEIISDGLEYITTEILKRFLNSTKIHTKNKSRANCCRGQTKIQKLIVH